MSTTYNKDYYATRKAAILAARKLRYDTDPEYRETIRKARLKAALKAAENQPKKPDKYVSDLEFVLEDLDITVWRFREWLKNNYIPQPFLFGKKFWFTKTQVELLHKLSAFFLATGRRLSKAEKASLQVLTDEITVNWTTED